MGPLNEITRAFHHLSTQLALVGFKAKVSKWKLWNPSRISPSIHILNVPMGFQNFSTHFLDEKFISRCGTYQQSSFLRKRPKCFGHFVIMYSSSTFLFHADNASFFFFLVSFGEFQQKRYAGMWGHYGSRIVGVFLGPLN